MNEPFKVNIGGELRSLKFNNFAQLEIAKILFKEDPMSSNPAEVVNKLYEISDKNIMLLMKVLVYAGIIGNDYEKGFDSDVSQEMVGEWISNANLANLVGVWETFLNWMGEGIPDDLMEVPTGDGEGQKKR
jgi:hypothetical protein